MILRISEKGGLLTCQHKNDNLRFLSASVSSDVMREFGGRSGYSCNTWESSSHSAIRACSSLR